MIGLAFPFAASSGASATQNGPPARDVVRVLRLPFLSHAAVVLAEADGFFAAQGIELDLVRMDSSASAITALAQGQLDVAPMVTRAGVFAAISKGADLRIVADAGHLGDGCSFGSLAMRKGPDGKAVRSGRIALSPMSTTEYFARTALEGNGIPATAIEIVAIPDRLQLEAVRRGSVDGAMVAESERPTLEAEGGFVFLDKVEKWLPGMQQAVVVFGARLLRDEGGLGRRFMAAYLQGVERYNEGKTARNLDLLSRVLGLDRADLVSRCWLPMAGDAQINTRTLDEFQEWAVGRGWLSRAVPAARYRDRRFVPAQPSR